MADNMDTLHMKTRVFDFTHFPHLETDRLILRQMTPADVNDLLRHFGNPEVVRFIDAQPIKTLDQANEWLRWMGSFFSASDGLRWGVERKTTGEFIGSAGLHSWNREANYAEIGYDLTPPHWGQGYATEVAQAIIEFAWEQMKLNRIEADVVSGNIASIRVLEKLGFRREGILRQRMRKGGNYYDVLLYGLLRCDYMGNCE